MPRIPRLRKGAPEAPQAPEASTDQPTQVTHGDPLADAGPPAAVESGEAQSDATPGATTSGDPLAAPRPAAETPTTSGDPLTGPAPEPPAETPSEEPREHPLSAPAATSGGDALAWPSPATGGDPLAAPAPTADTPSEIAGTAEPATTVEATAAITAPAEPTPATSGDPLGGATATGGQPTVVAPAVGAGTPGEDSATVVEEVPADAAPGFRERARIRRRLRYLRRYRELAFRDLGGLTFDLHRFGRDRPDLVAQKLDNLGTVDREVRALETALRERHDMTHLREAGIAACPRCQTLHDTDANFCPGCGTALRGAVVRDAATVTVTPAETPAPETKPDAPA